MLRFRSKAAKKELDMTPMIDITFLLIAFFMVLINFSKADQDERIRLPASELAKPAEQPLVEPVVLQITEDGNTLFKNDALSLPELRKQLSRHKRLLEIMKTPLSDVTVVVRADGRAAAGIVQDVIQICRDLGLENYKLRARHAEE